MAGQWQEEHTAHSWGRGHGGRALVATFVVGEGAVLMVWGRNGYLLSHSSWWLLAGPSEPGQAGAIGSPGGSQDKTSPACERGFPCTASPVREKNKQAPLFFFIFNWQWSSRGGVTLSRAQPALSLLTAQKRCLWAQIPTFSSLEAVKMYFLLCHFSFWQAGSQVGLENVKVGNKVVR